VSLISELIRVRVDVRVAWIVKVLLRDGISCSKISQTGRLGVVRLK